MNRIKSDIHNALVLDANNGPPHALHSQTPLERVTVGDQVAQRIIALVKAGNLRAGDRLPSELEIAAAFHISRPSVREGLKKLSVLGVTESRQGGRYYITDLSTRRLIEPMHYMVMLQDYDVGAHLEARIAVDLALTRLACERSTPEEIAKVRELAKAGHQFTHDPVGFRLLDVEFHRTINEAARSPMLARLSQSLYELGFEFRRIATETSGVIPKSLADHDLIARALAARDPDMAEKAFRRHLNNVRESTIQARATAQARHTPGSANVKVIPATHIAARKKKKRSG